MNPSYFVPQKANIWSKEFWFIVWTLALLLTPKFAGPYGLRYDDFVLLSIFFFLLFTKPKVPGYYPLFFLILYFLLKQAILTFHLAAHPITPAHVAIYGKYLALLCVVFVAARLDLGTLTSVISARLKIGPLLFFLALANVLFTYRLTGSLSRITGLFINVQYYWEEQSALSGNSFFGYYVALCYLYFLVFGGRYRYLYLFPFLILCFLSGSRMGVAALVLCNLFYLALRLKNGFYLLPVCLLVIMFFAYYNAAAQPVEVVGVERSVKLFDYLFRGGMDGPAESRFYVYESILFTSLSSALNFFFGQGIEAKSIGGEISFRILESQYLRDLYETGIVPLSLLIFSMGSLAILNWKLMSKAADSHTKDVFVFFCIFSIVTAVIALLFSELLIVTKGIVAIVLMVMNAKLIRSCSRQIKSRARFGALTAGGY
ncbi:MAG: hypothetical protein A3G87_06070 [Omnitrophica bacterium RIFCSPLOWO2_12_FULL_50_11]|nr:MAG: hypothetical protein A3G87_06070 [Omnitrophica bacterium RIFCSPLOWO2_12_FULL_50_11]